MSSSVAHPLVAVLRATVDGVFPAPDGVVDLLPPDPAGTHAVVEFTAHSFVLTDREPGLLAGVDAYGGATQPDVLTALAGPDGWIGSLDLVMVRRAGRSEVDPLPETDRYDDHPRVIRARAHRRDLRVYGDDRGLVNIGAGLVGRTEISVELTGAQPRTGGGRSLVEAALAHVDADEPVFAQVAPGNAASVRLFLAIGFVPIGSEVLIEPG